MSTIVLHVHVSRTNLTRTILIRGVNNIIDFFPINDPLLACSSRPVSGDSATTRKQKKKKTPPRGSFSPNFISHHIPLLYMCLLYPNASNKLTKEHECKKKNPKRKGKIEPQKTPNCDPSAKAIQIYMYLQPWLLVPSWSLKAQRPFRIFRCLECAWQP